MFRDIWKNIGSGRILRQKMDQDLPTVMLNPELWHMVIIELSNSRELIHEICEWLEQTDFPCIVCNNTSNISRFYFTDEADATAFKLRWS